MKTIKVLLLLNLVAIISSAYIIYNKPAAPLSIDIVGKTTQEQKDFQMNMLIGLQTLFSEIQKNRLGVLSVHHYVKPHAEFFENCPECQKDRSEIIKSTDSLKGI
jgi:hypothetical protein